MARTVARFQEGVVLGGKFRVIREIGSGGMGAVYEVVHVLTHHHRALKVLHVEREKAQEASVRLLREASAAGRIGNKHIVETFDAGTLDSGDTYVVMELLEGESFAALLKRKNRIPLGELTTLIRQACDGLHAAHEAGIVHRDVKPANLFVTKRDGKQFLKIVDFGVSKFDSGTTEDTELTREGAMIGTPSYMSPEQVRGLSDVDGRADVYALGIILYTAASGKRPFGGGSVTELAVQIDRGRYTPLRDVRPDVPKEFADAVACAMATEREHRFPTAKALAEALLPFAVGEQTINDVHQRSIQETAERDPPQSVQERSISRSQDANSSQGSLAGAGQAIFSVPPQPTNGTSQSLASHPKAATANHTMTWGIAVAAVCVLGAMVFIGLRPRAAAQKGVDVATDVQPTVTVTALPIPITSATVAPIASSADSSAPDSAAKPTAVAASSTPRVISKVIPVHTAAAAATTGPVRNNPYAPNRSNPY
jgi:serine/threonine protein kinase